MHAYGDIGSRKGGPSLIRTDQLVKEFSGRRVVDGVQMGYPVVFDATHSLQLPSAAAGESGGDSRFVPHLARAAVAAGCDGVFMETHLTPKQALCDKATTVAFSRVKTLFKQLEAIDNIVS